MPIYLERPVDGLDHIRGDVTAPITLVEYGDFECHYCALAHPTNRELLRRYPCDLRFVFRHAPQTRLHPNAELAAHAAEAAGAQGKFWLFHDYLFENFGPRVMTAATATQLDLERFRADVESGRFRDVVRELERSGARSVRGTPTYFLDGARYEDSSALESMSAAIMDLRARR